MFKFLRRAATRMSIDNFERGVQELIDLSNRNAPDSEILKHIQFILKDAELAIVNSRKSEYPLNGVEVVDLCVTSFRERQIPIGNATKWLDLLFFLLKDRFQ